MQVLIDIPDEKYDRLIKQMQLDRNFSACKISLLPKGHGRLGDLDALEKLCTEYNIANSAYDNSPMIEQGHCSDGDCIWKPLFDFTPTIIEADK